MDDDFDIDELREFADAVRAEAQRCKCAGDAARANELSRIATEADILTSTLLRGEHESQGADAIRLTA